MAVALLQALWTQAREQLKVLTIICANNTYAILKASAAGLRHAVSTAAAAAAAAVGANTSCGRCCSALTVMLRCWACLQVEAMRQRTGQANSLTSLAGPAIDWVALATGMGVGAGRADTCEQLAELMRRGLQQPGPFLIHAALG